MTVTSVTSPRRHKTESKRRRQGLLRCTSRRTIVPVTRNPNKLHGLPHLTALGVILPWGFCDVVLLFVPTDHSPSRCCAVPRG
jgi:hypothetical protein